MLDANLTDITLEQLLKLMDKEHADFQEKCATIQKLTTFSKNTAYQKSPLTINKEVSSTKKKEEVDSDFEDEVDYYLTQLNKLSLGNITNRIHLVLPSIKNYNYKRIILRLKLECFKALKEIAEFLESEKDNLTEEDILDFASEKELELKKIELLTKILKENDNDYNLTEENTLIFVPTSSGNIRALSELEKMPVEYYGQFNELLLSIKDGTFKNIKRFVSDGTIEGICEVKGFQTRIAFDRIDKNTYAIISCFIKKTDNSFGYKDSLRKKISNYNSIKEVLKAKITDEEFLSLNKLYEQEIFNLLGNTTIKEKVKVDE